MSGDLSGFSMMELFRMEARATPRRFQRVGGDRGDLAAPEVVEPFMRQAHSLEGRGFVGLDAAVRVAHAMEDCFVAARKASWSSSRSMSTSCSGVWTCLVSDCTNR